MTDNRPPAPANESDDSQWRFDNGHGPMSQQRRNGITGEVFYRHNSAIMPTEWVYLPDRRVLYEVKEIEFDRDGHRCIIVDQSGRRVRYLERQVHRKNCVA